MGEVIRRRASAPTESRLLSDDPLLAELREDYSQWHLIAENTGSMRFWASELGRRVSQLQGAGLIKVGSEAHPGKWLRRDIWLIAVPAHERCTCGFEASIGGRNPSCPSHGQSTDTAPAPAREPRAISDREHQQRKDGWWA